MSPRALVFAAACLLPLGLSGSAFAQEEPTNQIHYPLADELEGILRGADNARRAGKIAQAVELYRTALDGDGPEKGYRIVTLPEPRDPSEPRRFVGVTEWAIRGLRALPPEGLKLFRTKYDYRASSALDEALGAPDPFRALARAYELYPVSGHAPRILERMADLALEQGELSRARRVLRRLLDHHADELPSPPRILQKLLVCAVGRGDADSVREVGLRLERESPLGKIQLSGAPVALEELIAQSLRNEAIRAGRHQGAAPSAWLPRGDAANRAQFDLPVAVGPKRFRKVFARDIPMRSPRGLSGGTLGQSEGSAASLALVDAGVAFVVRPTELLAYRLDNGAPPRRRIPRLKMQRGYREENPKIVYGGAIDRGLLVAPFVEEVLREQNYRGIPIKVNIPIRKLAAFDLQRWAWAWDHARSLRDHPMSSWSFPAPPVTKDGVVYASAYSIEGFVNCYVTAFDARSGDPLWSTWVASGQVEQTMFGEHAVEPFCVPVAVSEGTVFYVSSFGCVAALDADNGRPRWVTEYQQIEVQAPRGYYAQKRETDWEANAPIVTQGVMVAAPMDSPDYYGFDVRSGQPLWQAERRPRAVDPDMRYLLGAAQGRVVLGGGHQVRCLDVRGGKLKWIAPLRGRVVAGRGLVAGRKVCVPVENGELLLLDLASGERVGDFSLGTPGNLLLCGKHLIVSSSGTLAVHPNGVRGRGGRDF